MPRVVQWLGPKECDLCKRPCKGYLYDGQTASYGSWATMCKQCFGYHGVGLGTGKGQEYRQDKVTGDFVKSRG